MKVDQNTEIFEAVLNSQSADYGVSLPPEALSRLTDYYKLLETWNSRLHLVAPCSPAEFATRHVLESLFLLNYLSEEANVIDLGSGGGLPIIPCLIVRPSLNATLIESSKRKCVFLRQALKHFDIGNATVLADRFENISGLNATFVTCRALDRFTHKLQKLIDWAPSGTTLLLYGGNSLREELQHLKIGFEAQLLPDSKQRFLFKF